MQDLLLALSFPPPLELRPSDLRQQRFRASVLPNPLCLAADSQIQGFTISCAHVDIQVWIVLLTTLYSYVYSWNELRFAKLEHLGINPYFWIIENVHLLDWDMVFDGWIGTWESLDAHSLSCLCTTWWLQLDSSLTLISTCELSANSLTVPSNALVKIANYSPFVSFITLLRVHCGKEQPKLVSFFFSCSKFPVWTTVVYSCLGIKLDLVFFFW